MNESRLPVGDPLWFKDAIVYELRVRSFYDANGDGIGDFPGLTAKLDYLQALGVTALWLLPFYPSPLKDDGYDISDYAGVHPDLGTLRDLRALLAQAHRRGLRVITELVLNHTSDQHAWFQRARRAMPGSRERDFYVWSETPERYRQARVIFEDFERSNWAWDPLAGAYYFHRFYAHQPDLNYDNPAVRKAILKTVDFWLDMGVDGLRLDAVPYLYKREGTNCENLPETHAFLRELRAHVDANFPGRMLLGEANQWPEDAVAYLADGKECHMAFHFPLMPRMFMAVRLEDRFPLVDIWSQTPEIHPSSQWALFLRNHDELTLEMVTDEERDYMYRAYAREPRMRLNLGIRRRLAPLLGNNRRAIELHNALLMSLPGTPVIYYGDEIGMGDNIYLGDRDGVRTPMQWSADRNAGFSAANPQSLILPVVIDHEYHYQTVNVEAQEGNLHSLLWWMRRLVALRRQFRAFGRGTVEFLNPSNPRVLAFIRAFGEERVLVVANLSRFVQYVELDLARFKGMVAVELFGRNPFPPLGEAAWPLSLGPHGFLWFSIEEPRRAAVVEAADAAPARIEVAEPGGNPFGRETLARLSRPVASFVARSRWFAAKARHLKGLSISHVALLPDCAGRLGLGFLAARYAEGEPENYLLPLGFATDARAAETRARAPEQVIAEVERHGARRSLSGIVYDASADPELARALLAIIERRRTVGTAFGKLLGFAGPALRLSGSANDQPLAPRLLGAEQSNTSIAYGDRLLLKLFRKIEAGLNPELELGRFLTERVGFEHAPALVGWLEHRTGRNETYTLAVMHRMVANQGDAWQFTLGELGRYYEQAASTLASGRAPAANSLVELLHQAKPHPLAEELIGAYLDAARLMGRRAAELHRALSSDCEDPAFAPEPYSALHRRSVYQSLRNLLGQVFRLLAGRLGALAAPLRGAAESVLALRERAISVFEAFLRAPLGVARIRCHGDLHLGQMLNTGKDFVIIDFEGEPARSLGERRGKRTALRDVAGMIRSFHYAAHVSLGEKLRSGALGETKPALARQWAAFWQRWASWAFVKGYLEQGAGCPFVPAADDELRILLDTFTLEKAIYELGYELNHRPQWVEIALRGVADSLGARLPDEEL